MKVGLTLMKNIIPALVKSFSVQLGLMMAASAPDAAKNILDQEQQN